MKFVIIFTMSILFGCMEAVEKKIPTTKQGVLDLSDTQVLEKTIIPLEGDWEFYWNQLHEPTNDQSQSKITGFLSPGQRWTGQRFEDTILPGIGYATYRIKIILSKEALGKVYGIKFKTTGGAAYKIFINEDLLEEFGKVGTSKESMIPTRKSGIVYFNINRTILYITVQISNFHHADGSFWYVPKFGTGSNINFQTTKSQIMEATLIGCIFIMAIYHFSIYLYRRKENSSLFFSLFCLVITIYLFFVDEVFIYYLFPDISFDLAHRILVVYYLSIPLYLYFLYTLFPENIPLKFLHILTGIFFSIFLFIFFNKLEIGSAIERTSILFVMGGFIYSNFLVIKSYLNKRKYSFYILIPNTILTMAIANDILSIYSFIHTPTVISFAMFLFILFQSVILAMKFSESFTNLEILSDRLETMVEERTFQYKTQKEKAEEANAWKDKFVSLVSHDLRAPLSTVYSIMGMLETNSLSQDEESKELIEQSKLILFNSMSSVKHLLNLSKFTGGKLEPKYSDIDLNTIFSQLLNELSLDLDRKNIKVKYHIQMDTILTVDESIIYEVFRNILVNSIKFSKEHGHINVDYTESDEFQIITIADNGIGIPKSSLENLLKVTTSTPGTHGERGFGIGLKLCNDLMKLHKGTLKIESIEGYGTQVSLFFPNNKKTVIFIGKKDISNVLNEKYRGEAIFYIHKAGIHSGKEVLKNVSFDKIFIDKQISEKDVSHLMNEIKLDKQKYEEIVEFY